MTPQWWDRRSAAQVHLMAMSVIAIHAAGWGLVAASRAMAILWPLFNVLFLVALFLPRIVVAWRLGSSRQERLLRQAQWAIAGVPEDADIERWRPYLESRIRQHSPGWPRATITFAVVAISIAGTLALRGEPQAYWIAFSVAALIGFVGRWALLPRGRNVGAPSIGDLQYVLDHLPERTDESRVVR